MASPSSPLPLRLRLRAWWQGYDPAALSQRLMESRPANAAPRRVAAPNSSTLGAHVGLDAQLSPSSDWTDARLAAAQLVWGPGLLGPHNGAATLELTRLLKLRRGMRVVHLGAELGGVARLLERSHACRVTSFENDPQLLAAAAQIGNRVLPFTAEAKAEGRPFHHAVVDGLAHQTGEFAAVMRRLRPLLLDQATVVIRAFIAPSEEAKRSPKLHAWMASERTRLRLMTHEELIACVQQAGFGLRGSEDRASAYVEAVERAWRPAIDLVRSLHDDPGGRPMIPLLLAEGEQWARRLELIREKALGVVRIIAIRRDRPPHQLKDW